VGLLWLLRARGGVRWPRFVRLLINSALGVRICGVFKPEIDGIDQQTYESSPDTSERRRKVRLPVA
jgi:hypothetical protein